MSNVFYLNHFNGIKNNNINLLVMRIELVHKKLNLNKVI